VRLHNKRAMAKKHFHRNSVLLIPLALLLISCNPFAPGLDDASGNSSSLLSDQRNTDGVFQNLKYAYTFRDTTIYGQLFDGNFTFYSYDYDLNQPITWGRDEEMRTANKLFQFVQRLDLVWNDIDIPSSSVDSTNTLAVIKRSFNLTVTFSPSDILYVNGYAKFTMERQRVEDPWLIVRWSDEYEF
jgi:hypothetical protein